jgi:hypothetical protein
VRRVSDQRSENPDLLTHMPGGAGSLERDWMTLVVDPVAELEELAELLGRGLISEGEFERQRRKTLGS